MARTFRRRALLLAVPAALLAGCGPRGAGGPSAPPEAAVRADGSSTVYPILEAAAEEFRRTNPAIHVTVGVSGTGGGFKKFVRGETDLSNASRPIKRSEAEQAREHGIEYIELPIAYDALTVVVNPANTWADAVTVAELKKIWEPAAQGRITRWSQVRPGWPDRPLKLYGPGPDSGTFDYFTEAIVGQEDSSRGDYTASEDDNLLVQGVSQEVGALGYFGIAYYLENRDRLKALAIDDGNPNNGRGPQLPTAENVVAGVYQPLSRPLLLYVNRKSADRPEVSAFVEFLLERAPELVRETGYVPLPADLYDRARARFRDRVTGSLFEHGGSQVGVDLRQLMRKAGERAGGSSR